MARKRSLILVHRYFWPDTPPYAAMLADIARAAAADGFEVHVLTAQPSYGDSALHDRAAGDEVVDGVHIVRLPLLAERKDQTLRRAVNLLAFAAQVWWRIRRSKNVDAVMAATTPPVLVATAARAAAAKVGADFIYHNQDIYPEVLGPSDSAVRTRVGQMLRSFDARTGKRATNVVVLSDDMAAAWRDRGARSDQLVVINNFDPFGAPALSDDEPAPVASGHRRIVFSGNIGRFQQVPTLVQAVEALRSNGVDGVELVVVGDGVEFEACKRVAGEATTLVGRVSPAQAAAWLETADLAVISLSPGLIRFVYPSKTFGYLAAGVPLLAIVEPTSELGRTVTDKGIGWAVDPSNAEALRQALSDFAAVPDETLDSMRHAARELSRSHTPEVVLAKWVELFERVTQ